MRKSIVLVTLAALTAAFAMGCASSGEAVPSRPLLPYVASDYVVHSVPERELMPAPRVAAPLAPVSMAPQRPRATALLARPTPPTGR